MISYSVFFEHILDAAKQTGLSVEAVCEKVKGFGFDALEMDAKRLQADEDGALKAVLSATGLGIHTTYNFFDFGSGEDWQTKDRADAQAILALCKAYNSKNLLAVAGFLKADEMDRSSAAYAARRDRMAQSLQMLVDLAAEQGITVVMEDFDGEDAPFSTAAELLWFMQNVNGLRCGFDTGNFLYSGEDAVQALPDFLPHLASAHLKDRGWTPNDGEPKKTLQGRMMYPVAVGDGDLDIAGMVKTILDNGFQGTLAAEHFGSANQLRDMERSAVFMKALVEKYRA